MYEIYENLLNEKGVKTSEVCRATGIPQSTFSDWKKGKSNPKSEKLQKLADYFDVSVDYLTGKSDFKNFYEEFQAKSSVTALINSRLEELGMTIKELATRADVPVRFINNLENIDPNESDYDYVSRLALTLGLQPGILKSTLSKQEPPTYDNSVSTIPSVDFSPVSINDFANIPILGSVRAGQPMLAQDNIEGYNLVPKKDLCSDQEYFYLRVQGDSMNQEFKEGTLLLIEKAPWVENGTIAVVLIDGLEATVKKVIQNEDMITLIPMSTNPEHLPQMYDVIKDQIQIVGRVKQATKIY